MGHDKLRKFAENKTFTCLVQPSAEELLADGYFNLRPHALKGKWAEEMFKRPAGSKIVLELGCGRGEYTIDLARRYPDTCFIGVDIKGARLWKGAKTATQEAIPNVAFLRTRIEFIEAFFAPGEIDEIWLTFSDPQLKSENSRLTSPVFLERYRKFLKDGGTIHLKTDSRFLHEYSKAVVEESDGLELLCAETDLYGDDSRNPLIDSSVYEVQTYYEKIFLTQGLPITYLKFTMSKDAVLRHPSDFDEKEWKTKEQVRLSVSEANGIPEFTTSLQKQ